MRSNMAKNICNIHKSSKKPDETRDARCIISVKASVPQSGQSH